LRLGLLLVGTVYAPEWLPPPSLPPAAHHPGSPPAAPQLLALELLDTRNGSNSTLASPAADPPRRPPFELVLVHDANGTTDQTPLVENVTSSNATDTHVHTSDASNTEHELAALCELWRPAAYVHLSALPLWILLICFWVVYCLRHEDHVFDLHRLLAWVPLVELVHALLSAFHFLFCPWRNTIEKIWGAAWVVVSILKEPIMLVCLLMLAKGWCITRPHLQYREVVHSSLLITLLYMCVIYELSNRGVAAVVPAVIMFLVMLYAVVMAILTNLRVLKAQLLVLRAFRIDATTTPAYAK